MAALKETVLQSEHKYNSYSTLMKIKKRVSETKMNV